MANTLKFGNGEWATKEGSTLAYNDENGNFKPLPFDFSRSTSATRVNKEGLIEVVSNNEPRIDFSNDAKGALLLEPSRSNVVTYSESFDNAAWAEANLIVTVNQIASPDGNINADLLETTLTEESRIRQTTTQSGSTAFTFSCFAKKGNVNFLILRNIAVDIAGGSRAWFNLDTGVIGAVNSGLTASMQNYGNGWYRCTITGTTDASPTNLVDIALSSTDNSFTGSAIGSNIYIYGAQLEEGSYPTSYIPTQGSSVTRVSEICNGAGNDQVINSTEGVLYYESKVHSLIGDKAISVSSGSYNDSVSIGVYGGVFQSRIRQGGNFIHFISPSGVNLLDNNKIAIMYSQSNIKIFVNGSLKSTVSGVTYSVNLSKVSFTRADITDKYYGLIKDLRVYNTALTDQELINLTTI